MTNETPLYILDTVLQVTGGILQFFLKREKRAEAVSVHRQMTHTKI